MADRRRLAIYPGSFDPLTNGHVDIIERGANLFETVVVAVLVNAGKQPMFSVHERVAMARDVFAKSPNIEVESFAGLLVDYARQRRASVIVKGLRGAGDFEYEMPMALMNRHLSPEIETVFLMSSEKYSYVSSRLIRDIAAHGGPVTGLVPAAVESRLTRRRGGLTSREV